MDWTTVIGTDCVQSLCVAEQDLADAVGSGELPVLATPRMAALMEQSASLLLSPYLEDGVTTVGVRLSLSHTAPTLPGARVYARATLTQADGRHFSFAVRAWDDSGDIGEGTHERVSVKADRFLEKAAARRDSGKI